MNARAQQMLVIKLSSLGDLFHALPAVTMIRKSLGFAVDWVTQPEYVDLVSRFDGVRRVYAFPRRAFATKFMAFARDLRRDSYDLILDFQGLLKSAMVARLARGRLRVGPSYAREGAHLFYDEIAGVRNKNRHAVEEALDFVRALGLPREHVQFPIHIAPHSIEGPRPHIGLVPFSRWPTKNWPLGKFAQAACLLRRQQPKATFHLFGALSDQEEMARLAAQIGGNVVNYSGKTSLVDLAALIQSLDVLITVDSGPMHVAAAFGVPVVAVFGATDPVRTGPYGSHHRVLVLEKLPCRPCFSDFCARGDLACLNELPAEKVADAALDVLSARGFA